MYDLLNRLPGILVAALLLPACQRDATAAQTATSVPATLPVGHEHDQRMQQFREAKYGLFIHWGLYAIPAEIEGKSVER